jgi:chaperone BCS1
VGPWYHRRGLPHRLGLLLHGRPGNGKTSLVNCIASRFHLNICLLAVEDLGNTLLSTAIAQVPPRSLVLVEDVDCARLAARRPPAAENGAALATPLSRGTSLSEVLNALDGVLRSEGYLLILTSNHPEQLDPALLRPGRVDRTVELCGATREQAGRMLRKFFPDVSPAEEAAFCVGLPEKVLALASLQGHLVQHAANRALALAPDWTALLQRQAGFGARDEERPAAPET